MINKRLMCIVILISIFVNLNINLVVYAGNDNSGIPVDLVNEKVTGDSGEEYNYSKLKFIVHGTPSSSGIKYRTLGYQIRLAGYRTEYPFNDGGATGTITHSLYFSKKSGSEKTILEYLYSDNLGSEQGIGNAMKNGGTIYLDGIIGV